MDDMMKELLVVDDEPRLCVALKAFFEEKGFHVTTATTAQAALEQVRQVPAEVVLLDLRLPDGSGLDILSRLKDARPGLRVVVISGVSDSQAIDEALQRGASSYLTKPFDFDQCFYAALGIETVDLTTAQPDPAAIARIPEDIARQYQVVPLRYTDGVLHVATGEPLQTERLGELHLRLECEVQPVAVARGEIEEALRYCYGRSGKKAPRPRPEAASSASSWPVAPHREEAEADRSSVSQLVKDLIQHAYANRATDLHLGVSAQGPWVRERIDSALYTMPVDSRLRALYPHLVAHLKVMANLDVAEHRLPQDGRVWFELGATQLDLCISVLPTPAGEHIAIRLLGPSSVLRVEQLGLDEEQGRQLEALLTRPAGLLLVAGPAGSGKSTTLYAFLSRFNTGRLNIVTIEHPIEHELSGVTQLQVQPKVGLTFANGLRAAMRHDPNLIMVGEIADQEIAALAVGAASTGHLVLAGMHTNQAASAVTRLLDLDVEPFALCSALSGVLSQRLVRRLCNQCRHATPVDAAALTAMGITPPGPASGSLKVWGAKGCKQCRGTGYYGRTAVFELLTVDQHLRSLIIKRTSTAQLRQSAISRGMTTLWQSAWQQMQAGHTSLEELSRVLPPELR